MRTTQPSTKDRVLKMILKQSISIKWNQCDQFFVERIKRHIHPPWAKKGGPNLATIVNYVSFEEVDSTRLLEMQIDSGLTWTDHVDMICVFTLPSFAKSCSPDLPKMSTTEYIHSNLSYGIRLWGLLYKSIWKGLKTTKSYSVRIISQLNVRESC